MKAVDSIPHRPLSLATFISQAHAQASSGEVKREYSSAVAF
jgi:hypothetical protein